MSFDDLKQVIFAEAQRQAEEILRSAEEEIERLRTSYEAELHRLHKEFEEEKSKAMQQLREKWELETEYEKRTIKGKLVNEIIEDLKDELMRELLGERTIDRYVDWLLSRVPDAQEWLVDGRYSFVAERLAEEGLMVSRTQGGIMARKGQLLLDLSPETVIQGILERYAHEIYEQVAKILP